MEVQFAFYIVITLISFIAIVANTVIFVLVIKKKKLKPHSYIAVLALIDFSTATVFLTLHYLKQCTAALYVLGLLSRLSFVLLTVISWERYSAVRFPLRYRLSYHRFWQMMAWLLVPLVLFVALYTWGVSKDLGRTRWEEEVGMCMLVEFKKGMEIKIIETTSLLFPFPLLAVMTYCYAYIFKEYRRHIRHPVQRAVHREEAKASMHSCGSSCQSLHKLASGDSNNIFRVLPGTSPCVGLRQEVRSLVGPSPRPLSCSSVGHTRAIKCRSLSPTAARDIKLTLGRELSLSSIRRDRSKSLHVSSEPRVHSAEQLDQYIGDVERRKQFSVAISLLAVIMFNLLTWLPYCINYLTLTLDVVERVKPLASAIMYSFLYSSVGFNTIIYSSRCRDIKEEFGRVVERAREVIGGRDKNVRVLVTPDKNLHMVIDEVESSGGKVQ
ncbi:hypothetical protein ACHWQZ_G003484 [Mnemiopsis leidyi]